MHILFSMCISTALLSSVRYAGRNVSQKKGADWQKYHGGICPSGFGEQLQDMALQEKKTHQTNLWTKYNSPPSFGKPSIADKMLDGVQFNLGIEASY
jgi:hypothetical protein